MRILIDYKQDLIRRNVARQAYRTTLKDMEETIEDGLLQPMTESLQGVKKVDVFGFKDGSVIALFYVFMDVNAPKVNVSSMQSAVDYAITTGNFSDLPVDRTYLPVIGENTFL